MSCKVKGCRNKLSHVTKYHMCGKCNNFGHGQVECGNEELTNNLIQYFNDTIDIKCEVPNCSNNQTHTTDGHICIFCDKNINMHLKVCPEYGIKVPDENIRFGSFNEYEFLQLGEYYERYVGMGCAQYVRRNKNSNLLESLFMHSDNWGQYGADTSDLPRYKAFIYEYIKNETDIE